MTKEVFLTDVQEWNNHLYFLWLALEDTKKTNLPVIEFGSGDGSSARLRKYCFDNKIDFYSYDYDFEWAAKTGAVHVPDWSVEEIYQRCSVFFCDESPGENRHLSILRMKNLAEIIVVHDSQEQGYELNKVFHLFKYRIDYIHPEQTATTTALSNKIDVTKWVL